ncbi:hypothetical protein [Staphylococcus haemolyticus]|uniref:hypothetical protein n=1 Tax=Staphylococcus haemolyticus TaxID=1283 RepID=UPI001F0B4589|nr:hypothetical protein [Staphylococcus haemolyticus]MCH4441723.1 hypothetical protein [Staphylococcus haemolyticus]
MPITETQKQALSESVEDVLQSRNFAQELESSDAYLYEEFVKQALQQNDVPDDIEARHIDHELKMKSKISGDAWAEFLINEVFFEQGNALKAAIDKEDILVETMLGNMEDNFDVEVELKEEISEVRNRKPTIESLTEIFNDEYDENEFVERLRQNENEILFEKVKEIATENGFPNNVNVNDLEYSVTNVNLTQGFDTLAERYLDDAESLGDARLYAQTNLYNILEDEKAFNPDVEIDMEPSELEE